MTANVMALYVRALDSNVLSVSLLYRSKSVVPAIKVSTTYDPNIPINLPMSDLVNKYGSPVVGVIFNSFLRFSLIVWFY